MDNEMMGQPQAGGQESGAAPQAGQAKGSPAIKAEFERGVTAVGKALYSAGEVSDKILGMISEQDPVGSIAQAALMTVTQVDRKLDLPERVMPALTIFTADRLLEMAKEMGIQISDEQSKQVAMAAMEMVLTGYGVQPERAAQLAKGRSPEELKAAEGIYKGMNKNG